MDWGLRYLGGYIKTVLRSYQKLQQIYVLFLVRKIATTGMGAHSSLVAGAIDSPRLEEWNPEARPTRNSPQVTSASTSTSGRDKYGAF